MEQKYPHLFQPMDIRGIRMRNRILSAPLGLWSIAPQDGYPEHACAFFEERAAGGAANVTLGDTQINQGEPEEHPLSLSLPLRSRESRALLSSIADRIQRHGALASAELNFANNYYSPSPGKTPFGEDTYELTAAQISYYEEQFARCAAGLKRSGFQMLMLHGGHGWMLDAFLHAESNHRTDCYGGSLENRLRFPVEVATAVRKAVGEHFIIEYRVSGYDPDTEPEEFEELLALANALEGIVDIINVSRKTDGMMPSSPATFPTYLSETCVNVPLAAALKARIRTPVSAVGAITTPEEAEAILASGKADFVELGRALIADPLWPKKARACDAPSIRPCLGCLKCLDGMHERDLISCAVNPQIGRGELTRPETPASQPKHLVIIGGGPAGMTAAITAKKRGHQVHLIEQSPVLGGLPALFSDHPIKQRVLRYMKWLIRQAETSGIEISLNTKADAALLKSLSPDAIFLASGSRARIPDIPISNNAIVRTAEEAMQNPEETGDQIVIIGGNLTGCELGAELSSLGKKVTILEMTDRIHADAVMSVNPHLDAMLTNTTCRIGAVCTAIGSDTVTFRTAEGIETIPADTVIYAVGRIANDDLADAIRYLAPEYAEIGDCRSIGTIYEASASGYMAAMDL